MGYYLQMTKLNSEIWQYYYFLKLLLTLTILRKVCFNVIYVFTICRHWRNIWQIDASTQKSRLFSQNYSSPPSTKYLYCNDTCALAANVRTTAGVDSDAASGAGTGAAPPIADKLRGDAVTSRHGQSAVPVKPDACTATAQHSVRTRIFHNMKNTENHY